MKTNLEEEYNFVNNILIEVQNKMHELYIEYNTRANCVILPIHIYTRLIKAPSSYYIREYESEELRESLLGLSIQYSLNSKEVKVGYII